MSEPRKIGRYNVERLLGAGGMGAVYLAEDPALKRRLAIKIVQAPTGQQEVLSRFQREAEVSAHLNHPNVITIYDVGEDPAVGPFIAMEFVDGASLADLIRDRRLSTAEERLRALIPAMHAVDAAHAAGIVHRDIKPGNLMVARDGRVKLMDFGVARSGDSGLTVTGSVMGTPSYLAPEQLTGAEPSAATDRYAFAVMAFELFTGTKPYVGATTATLLYNIAHSPPTFPDSMPSAERALFERALAKEPAARFADLTSFLRAMIGATVADHGARDRLLAVLEPADARDEAVPNERSRPPAASPVAIADGLKPTTIGMLGTGALAGIVALGYGAWVFGRPALKPSVSQTFVQTEPAPAATPTTPSLALGPTPAVAPATAQIALAATPVPPAIAEPSVAAEVAPSNAAVAPTPAESLALASVPPEEPVEPRRPTGAELRNAVREALRDQGMGYVEVRVEPDGRVRLANLPDEAEAARASAVAGSVSDEPLSIETSIRTAKRPERQAPRRPASRHVDSADRADLAPSAEPAPVWEIRRGGAEQTE
ncbi:MAG: protein kinase [Candidatus Binatia bacterium]